MPYSRRRFITTIVVLGLLDATLLGMALNSAYLATRFGRTEAVGHAIDLLGRAAYLLVAAIVVSTIIAVVAARWSALSGGPLVREDTGHELAN